MRKGAYFLIFIIFIGFAATLLGGEFLNNWRPQMSYLFKHAPLCIAENVGLIRIRRAHYSEELKNTIDILRCEPAKAPHLIGGPFHHEFIVVSDLGGLVQRFDVTGALVWQVRLSMPRGLDIQDDRVLVGEGNKLWLISLKTGEKLQYVEFDHPILSFRRVSSNLFILLEGDGRDTISQYEISQNKPLLIRTSPVHTTYARGIDVSRNSVYIADTFGHRILQLDINTLDLVDQLPSYFPNSVHLSANKMLVAEEHLNVVSEVNNSPLKLLRTRIGCQKNTPLLIRSSAELSSTCASIAPIKLYSPNDAVELEGSVYIADTDNHRILEVFDGRVIGELVGFNNPINLRTIGKILN